MRNRLWLIARLPAFIISLGSFGLVILTMLHVGGVGLTALPEPLATLWKVSLNNPGPASAAMTGVLSVVLWQFAIVSTVQASAGSRQERIEQRFGKLRGRVLYATLTASYVTLVLVGLSAWGSFSLAGKALAVAYPRQAIPVVQLVAYAWLQALPGAVFFALQVVAQFVLGGKKKRKEAGEELAKKSNQEPLLHLSREFYLGKGVSVIALGSLVLWSVFGFPLLMGYGSGSDPATWKLCTIVGGTVGTTVLIGIVSAWLSSWLIWFLIKGRVRTDEDRVGRSKLALDGMVGSLPGSAFSSAAGLLPFLWGSEGGHEGQGAYAFWSHLVGGILGAIQVFLMARRLASQQD